MRLLTDDQITKFAKALGNEIKSNEKKLFGVLKVSDVIWIFGFIFTIFAFYLRTNDAMERLIKSTDYLSGFANNSDIYHSTLTGHAFKQGKPSNDNYEDPVRVTIEQKWKNAAVEKFHSA